MLTFKRFWNLMTGYKLLYLFAIIAAGFSTAFSMVNPIIIKTTIDNVLGGIPPEGIVAQIVNLFGGTSALAKNLWVCSIGIIGITAFNGFFSFARGKLVATASEGIAKRMKDNLYDHLQKLPYEYHIKAKTGDLIQRCTSDVDTVRRFLANQVTEIIRTIFIATFSLVIMSNLNVKLTLVSIIILPVVSIYSYVFFIQTKKVFKLTDEKEGELSTVLQENLSGVRVVRAFGRQNYEVSKFEEKNTEFRALVYKLINLLAKFWSTSDIMCFTQLALVLFTGVYLTTTGEISLGTFMAFNTYESMLIWPIRQLGRIVSDMGKMGVSLGRIYEIVNTPVESDTEGATKADLNGDIVFDNVCFEYESNLVLKDLSFKIKQGETIAILGSTGSGKSTIMYVLLRLYDYKSGSVKINGTEIRNIQKKWLREKIGMVLQEPFLFSKTIKDNIKMAKNEVEDHEVYEATKTASVHDVIEDFEKGYDTMVGEKGVTLSGGQKQRVAIARTLIKNSSILIFDDSLSAVDTETDAQIRAALKEKNEGTTTFIISQRITTLKEADRIFVLEQGRLSEQGTHEELIQGEGLYSRIWKIQTMLEDDFDNEVTE